VCIIVKKDLFLVASMRRLHLGRQNLIVLTNKTHRLDADVVDFSIDVQVYGCYGLLSIVETAVSSFLQELRRFFT